MTHKNVAEVGDRVKCYDFEPMEGRPEYYVVGTVIDKREYTYVVSVEEDTAYPDNPRTEIQIGFLSLLDYDNRITKV